ncbi:hypothetical protein J7889_04445 [Mycoplasmopsis agalactiae]|nr:hypothetical protein [Mycoplasmopsis agalactiae]
MFNELKNRKVAFELLAIAKQLGARDKFVSIFELEKIWFQKINSNWDYKANAKFRLPILG